MKPSPIESISRPSCSASVARTMRLWLSIVRRAASSPRRRVRSVEPSTSVNMIVTTPVSKGSDILPILRRFPALRKTARLFATKYQTTWANGACLTREDNDEEPLDCSRCCSSPRPRARRDGLCRIPAGDEAERDARHEAGGSEAERDHGQGDVHRHRNRDETSVEA